MERFLERGDLINGRHGRAVAVTEDGQREEMFYLKDVDVPVEVETTALKRLGTMKNIHFQGTPKQEWSATLYRTTRFFRDIMATYLKEGKETRFDLILVQNDPNHEAGPETVILKGCLLKNAQLIRLNIEEENAIEEPITGTFDDLEVRA